MQDQKDVIHAIYLLFTHHQNISCAFYQYSQKDENAPFAFLFVNKESNQSQPASWYYYISIIY